MTSIYYKELRNKLKNKAKRNSIFSLLYFWFIFLLKFLISLLVITTLPIVAFTFFLLLEPRDIPKLNDYLIGKVTDLGEIKNIEFERALFSLDTKFRLNYKVKDLKITFFNETKLKIPNLDINVDIIDFFKKDYIISSIILKNIYVSVKSENFKKIDNTNIVNSEINESFLKDIYNIANYINKKNIPLKNIIIKDSEIKFDGTKNNVNYILINFDKFKDSKIINFLMSIHVNQNENRLITNSYCKFYVDKVIECNIDIKDFSTDDLSELYNNDIQYFEYVNNIKTNLNGNAYAKFSDYTNLEYGNFNIKAENGSLNLKDVFGGRIDFKIFEVNGEFSNNFKNIKINNFNMDVVDDNFNSNLKLLLELKEDNMLLDIKLKNIDTNKINVFWPIFLDQKGIRDWVIEHIKDGYIDNAFAKIKFNKVNNNFEFDDIYSEIMLKESFIDIYETIPIIKNIDAKAVFTSNDMNIFINNGMFYNTQIKNGIVFSKFNANKSILDINVKSIGNAHELFYFINKNYKENIKDNVSKYLNGRTEAEVNVKINLDNDVDLDDFLIGADINIVNNASVVLRNNLNVKLNKNFNSNIFNVELDLEDAQINFPLLTINKKIGELEKINLGIEVQKDSSVLIHNFINNDKNYLDLNGNIFIKDGEIKNFELNSIYKENDFNFKYFFIDNIPHINVYGNSLSISNSDLESNLKNIKDLFFKTDNKHDDKLNIDINTDIKTLFYNKEFKNLISSISIKDNLIVNSDLKIEYGFAEHVKLDVKNVNSQYSQLKLHIRNVGKLIEYLGISNNIIGGKLNYIGQIDNAFNLYGDLFITQGIDIIRSNKSIKNIKKILESKFISQKTKDIIKNKSTIAFSELNSYVEIKDGIIIIKDLICFGKLIGIDITGKGKINIKDKTFNIRGLIIPAGAINRLLIIDKIPILNVLLLGEKNGGLFGVDYYVEKSTSDSESEFVINKLSVLAPGPIKGIINRLKKIKLF